MTLPRNLFARHRNKRRRAGITNRATCLTAGLNAIISGAGQPYNDRILDRILWLLIALRFRTSRTRYRLYERISKSGGLVSKEVADDFVEALRML